MKKSMKKLTKYKKSLAKTKKTKKIQKNLKKNKKISNKKLVGGSVDEFLRNKDSSIQIGFGGSGIVYFDPSQPTSVFKTTSQKETCSTWKKESKIYEKFNEYDIDNRFCKLLKMKEYKIVDDKCYMELTRAVNPENERADYTIHPFFGVDSLDNTHKGRGHFLGIKELIKKNYFTQENIEDYVEHLAIIMAKLHYLVQNDGYDLELFLSREGDNIVIYLADFDLSQFMTKYNNEDINRMEWSLSAVPYFPTRDQSELYEIFTTNYLKEAKIHNKEDIAIKVLEKYE